MIIIPYLHTWFWFIWLAIAADFAFWFLSVGICPLLGSDYCPDLDGALQATHAVGRYYFVVILAVFVALIPPFVGWFYVVRKRTTLNTNFYTLDIMEYYRISGN